MSQTVDGALEARYEKYREILKGLTLMSDIFMRNVFRKRECTEYVLQVILEKHGLKVVDQVLQKDYKNLQGRSAILDCVARDADRRQFDVEIQQETEGASPKRARYHSGLMDMNTLEPGQNFDELPETYVVFITREDVLGHDKPIYHIKRKIEETDGDFHDEAYIIYVNSSKQEDTDLGKLMHDFHCRTAEEMYSKVLAERVFELKETKKGMDIMCAEMEKLYNEGMIEGEIKGRLEGEIKGRLEGEMKKAKEMALSLVNMGIPIEQIAEAAKVSIKLVQEWLAGETSAAK